MAMRKGKAARFSSPMAATALSKPSSAASRIRRVLRRAGAIPGVVEHGLFIGLAGMAILAGAQGNRIVERRLTPQSEENSI